MLEGLDRDWTTGKGTNVVYQKLSKGNYIFKVRARKATAKWSTPIEFKITIKAHFWQHPIFFVFLSLLFTGLIALLIIRRKNIQIKRRELDNQLISLEQKALQSMMNPHFIFNSLGSIQTYLLQNKSGEAGLYLSQFARLIRQNLNAINASNINLEEEIDRLKNYLDLEKLRMEEKFDYEIKVAENLETDEVQIPSMIIQPFVENSIWHGIAFLKGKGKIVITFSMQGDKSLSVIVEDNGIGMKRSETYSANKEKRAHLGMELARKRLEILGKKFSINTSLKFSELFPDSPNPGTRVELVVPVTI
jgi:LytS/YehU family sensor histidine kinase